MSAIASLLLIVGGLWFAVGGVFALTGLAYSGMPGFTLGLVAVAPTCFLPGGVLLSVGALLRARFPAAEYMTPVGKVDGIPKRVAPPPRARAAVIPPWERKD